jgi:hypothetical protein
VFDIIFISYNEPNAEENLNLIRQRFPLVKHVSGIKGIHQAHIVAAKRCFTPMFWVVDADAVLLDSFNFDYQVTKEEHDIVHVWRSRNPVNNLEYGYGGVKLLPKNLTINMNVSNTDMTTSISPRFKVVDEISNITAFNTDEFTTWRSAFRECCKLASRSINGQDDIETTNRLTTWCTVATGDYAEYAINGALAGKTYGQENAGNVPALSLINNFDWLMSQFQQSR